MEIYTINRLYYEASALLDKYNAREDGYELKVEFEVSEKKGKIPAFQAAIHYWPERGYLHGSCSGYGATHHYALQQFEHGIREKKGLSLLNDAGVELSDKELAADS